MEVRAVRDKSAGGVEEPIVDRLSRLGGVADNSVEGDEAVDEPPEELRLCLIAVRSRRSRGYN